MFRINPLKWARKQRVAKEWVDEAEKATLYSPDAVELESKEAHLLFSCDETMKSRKRHSLLEEAERIVPACYTLEKLYVFKRRNEAGFSYPIPLRKEFSFIEPTIVRGELYKVPSKTLYELDKLKQNTVCFQRNRVTVQIPCTKVFDVPTSFTGVTGEKRERTILLQEAWMYVGISSYWKNLIDGGYDYPPVKRIHSQLTDLGTFHYFTDGGKDF